MYVSVAYCMVEKNAANDNAYISNENDADNKYKHTSTRW